jgi:hypothetical protein
MPSKQPYDFYKHLYSNLFKIPINKVTNEQRLECKVAVHAATYQGNISLINMLKKEHNYHEKHSS